VNKLTSIGLRRGKKKAIHLPANIQFSGENTFKCQLTRLFSNEPFGTLESNKKFPEGHVWISISPMKNTENRKSQGVVRLLEIKQKGEDEVEAFFYSKSGPIKRLNLKLDNRGRALGLKPGEEYLVRILSSEEFFSAYETKSIPLKGMGRAEPDNLGLWRLENFQELALAGDGSLVLDCATGLKGYLKEFLKNGSQLFCLNYSTPMLKRTREWLDTGTAHMVRYDADRGFPFKSECFDVVLMDAFLEYVKDPKFVLEACSDLLKPGGRLLLLEPVYSPKTPKKFYPQDLWEYALWRPIQDNKFSSEEFEQILVGAGLGLVERRTNEFLYPLFTEAPFSQSIGVYTHLQ